MTRRPLEAEAGLAVFLVVLMAWGAASSVEAQLAKATDMPISCESMSGQTSFDVWPEPFVDFPPKRLAWGNRAWLGIDSDTFVDDTVPSPEISGKQIRFEAANPSRPISRPFVRKIGRRGTTIRFERGDGVGRVTARWLQTYTNRQIKEDDQWVTLPSVTCYYERSRLVTPVPGWVPYIYTRNKYFGVRGSNQTVLNYDLVPLCRSRRGRATAASGRLTLRVRGAGGKAVVRKQSICHPGKRTHKRTHHWRATASGSAFMIRPTARKAGVRLVRFSVSLGRERLLSGAIRMKTFNNPLRRIWEGTDAFINACIGTNQRIYSRNGRLYCSVGGRIYTDSWVGKLRQ